MRLPAFLATATGILFCMLFVAAPANAAAMDHDPHHTMVMETSPVPEAGTGTAANGTPAAASGLWQPMVEESHARHSGGFTAHSDDDLCKIYQIVLGIRNDSAFVESAEIRYGHPPNPGYQNGNFVVTLRAFNKSPLISYRVWDPRIQVEQFGFHNELKRHEESESPTLEAGMEGDDIDLPLIIPYHREIRMLELADESTQTILVSVDLSPAEDAFRRRFPHDPDMMFEEHRLDSLPFLLAGASIFIVLAGVLVLISRKSG